jgi:hypothetical protein
VLEYPSQQTAIPDRTQMDWMDTTVERTDWSEEDNQIVIDAYFDMLHRDRVGRPFNKAEVNRTVQAQLPGRTRGSIEYKFQNISAVLDEAGHPYVTGYKPYRNYQESLRELVLARVTPK